MSDRGTLDIWVWHPAEVGSKFKTQFALFNLILDISLRGPKYC